LKLLLKNIVHAIALGVVFLPAAASGFGRVKPMFTLFAQFFAIGPGLLGDYLRVAYYRLTLASCALTSRISFGSFFAHPDARVGELVYIGPYCVLGRADIGHHTQIATGVQILSGNRQHLREADGAISGGESGEFRTVQLGAHCWIGAAAIVMANVGAGTTIGAGSVVTREIPPNSVAVGVPAKIVQREAPTQSANRSS
jgi:acetyltransferase-like isoleucine patch superfamily enzyme